MALFKSDAVYPLKNRISFCSVDAVYCIYDKNSINVFFPCGQITKQSSMYIINKEDFSCAVCIVFFSRLSTKRFAMTSDNGEPIGAPSICL